VVTSLNDGLLAEAKTHLEGPANGQIYRGCPLLSSVLDQMLRLYPNSTLLLLSFMSTRRDYVSELRPLTGLLFIPEMIYDSGEPWWNDTDRGKPKNSEKKPFPVPLCPPQIPHGLMPGANPGIRDGRPATPTA
jgi:hypothetical protein